MSLEVLKIFILACQVSAGGQKFGGTKAWERVDEYQQKCQKKLIECYSDNQRAGSDFERVKSCLLGR